MENFTLDYFKEETVRFRQGMGNKLIMDNPDKRHLLHYGYTMVYIQTKVANPQERRFLVDTYISNATEFTRREFYITAPTKKRTGEYYGYNLHGVAIPLPIIGDPQFGQHSKGQYVIEKRGDDYYLSRECSSELYRDKEFMENTIRDAGYIKFEIDPFSKTAQQWEEYSKGVWQANNK